MDDAETYSKDSYETIMLPAILILSNLSFYIYIEI
jgi:hypothetical protein